MTRTGTAEPLVVPANTGTDAGFTGRARWDLRLVPLVALFIGSGVLMAAGFSLAIALLFRA